MSLISLRLCRLHSLVEKPVDKDSVKLDAWVAKKMCILVKRKLQRGQVPREPRFRSLMSAVFPQLDWANSSIQEPFSTRVE